MYAYVLSMINLEAAAEAGSGGGAGGTRETAAKGAAACVPNDEAR